MKTVLFLFGELTDFDLDWLIQHGTTQRLRTGTVLIEEGRPIAGLYIVLEGLFEVIAGQTSKRTIGEMGAGEILGEISFLDSRPPTTTVKALTDCVIFAMPREFLSTKLNDDAAFAARFYRALGMFLAHRLRVLTVKFAAESDEASNLNPRPPEEMQNEVLAGVYLGGKRFERMLKRLTMT